KLKGKTLHESLAIIGEEKRKEREAKGEPAPDFRAMYRTNYQKRIDQVGLLREESALQQHQDIVIPVPEPKQPDVQKKEQPTVKVDKPFDREKDAPTCVKCGDTMALYDMKNVAGDVINGNGFTQVSYRCSQCDSGTKKVLFLCNDCDHLSDRVMHDGAKFKVCPHCGSKLKES
ncbi:MAG: hypothetical protein OWR52_04475, partial [Acidibacillus sp.]|nr:hypothetical protein [Acidibacillus sp.]